MSSTHFNSLGFFCSIVSLDTARPLVELSLERARLNRGQEGLLGGRREVREKFAGITFHFGTFVFIFTIVSSALFGSVAEVCYHPSTRSVGEETSASWKASVYSRKKENFRPDATENEFYPKYRKADSIQALKYEYSTQTRKERRTSFRCQ